MNGNDRYLYMIIYWIYHISEGKGYIYTALEWSKVDKFWCVVEAVWRSESCENCWLSIKHLELSIHLISGKPFPTGSWTSWSPTVFCGCLSVMNFACFLCMLYDLQAVLGIFLLKGISGELDFEAMNSNQIVHYGKANRKMFKHQKTVDKHLHRINFWFWTKNTHRQGPKGGPMALWCFHTRCIGCKRLYSTFSQPPAGSGRPRLHRVLEKLDDGKIGSPNPLYHVGKNNVINHPFGNGLYHLCMVIWW